MNQIDVRTPGRSQRPPNASALGQHDVLRRLRQLGLSAEAEPRVLRFLGRELDAALERSHEQAWTEEEIREAGGDDDLLARLRAARVDRQRAAALRAAGLHTLSADELQAVVAAARTQGS